MQRVIVLLGAFKRGKEFFLHIRYSNWCHFVSIFYEQQTVNGKVMTWYNA